MKKNNVLVFALVVVISIFYLIPKIALSNQISVKKFKAIIDIDSNGDMNVSETWVVKWPEGYTVSFRDIGYGKYNKKNPLRQDTKNIASIDTSNISVEVFDKNNVKLSQDKYRVGYNGGIDERGLVIECVSGDKDCEQIFIQVYGGMQSQMTFKYNYKIEGAITKYMDTAELNWNLLQYFESGIDEAYVEINLPTTSKSDIKAWGHGLGNGEVKLEDSKVILNIGKIKVNEFLEFRVLFPKDIVNVDNINELNFALYNEIINYENELAIETNRRIMISSIIFYGTFVIFAISIFAIFYIYKKYDKEHKPIFKGTYYRELPRDYSPAEMSYLYYFKNINNEDVTATLLDLIRRKYLELDNVVGANINSKDPDFIIRKVNNNLNDLLSHEKHIIEWFIDDIGNCSEVSLSEIENYCKKDYQKAKSFQDNATTFVRLAKLAGSKHDFFETVQRSNVYGFVLFPFIYFVISLFTQKIFSINNTFALVVSIILSIILLIYIASIKKRSINGNEDFAKWKAFKNFLLDFGSMQDYPIQGVVVWEHYLVYATSLKIADKVMEQLEVKLPNIDKLEGYDQATFTSFGYRYYGFHLGYTLGRINTSVATARNNSIQTITSHNATKISSGGGGGFSGGSSFGGGGGGFGGR